MKKTLLYLAGAAALLAGCAKEVAVDEPIATPGSKTITIQATIDPETRTTVDINGNTGVYSWEEGETIKVLEVSAAKDNQEYKVFEISDAANGLFTGELVDGYDIAGAFTPTSVFNGGGVVGEDVNYFLDMDGRYYHGSTNAVMVAGAPTISDGMYKFTFKHVAALFKVTYENVPVGTKQLSITTDQPMTTGDMGGLEFRTFENAEITVSNVPANAPKTITVSLHNAVDTPNQTLEFYAPIPTGTYGSVSVSLVDGEGNVIEGTTKSKTKSFTVKRGDIVALPTITLEEETPASMEYSIVFIDKTTNETGLSTSTQASTVIEESSLSYVTKQPFTAVNKVFYGGDRPLRIGTSSAIGSLTIALSEAGKVSASSIIVNAKQYSSGKTKVIGVNGSEKQQPGNDYTDLSFAGGNLNEIVLDADGYIIVKYIKVVYTPKDPVSLSFPESVYTINAGDSFTAPVLTTTPSGLVVTYSSSNEEVATVNETTGAITLQGGIGSTTITATFAGDNTYNAGSASYILTVNRVAATSIAQIKADLANGSSEFSASLTNAIVTRKYSDYIAYIQDGTAGILVTDAENLTQGDSYTGTITGEMETYQNQPRITSIDVTGATKTADATIPTPTEVTIETLIGNMSDYDGKLCKIVKAKANSTLATGNNKSIIIAQGNKTMTLFTRPSFEEGAVEQNDYYDIIGVPCLYGSTNEIVVLSTDDVVASSINWQLSGIAVKTAPTKTAYYVNEFFNPAGLVLSTTMEDVTDNTITKAGADVSYSSETASDFTFTPSLTTPLAESNTSVTIVYGGKTTSLPISVTDPNTQKDYYKLVTSVDDITEGQYVIGALRSTSASNTFYFATTSVNSGDWVVEDTGLEVASINNVRRFETINLPSSAEVFTLSGNNKDGFTISGGEKYLYYTSYANRKLAFGTDPSYLCKFSAKSGALVSGGVIISMSHGTNGAYTISENSTAAGAIRGYASTTQYRAIYLFKKVTE